MNEYEREMDLALAEAEQENRLLRARNERLENTVVEYEQLIRDLTDALRAKSEWVGLTDEEANELWESTDSDWELMKRVEAKLKEKNT
jgi:hypothetical protein